MTAYICLILAPDSSVMRAEDNRAPDEAGAIRTGHALSRQVAGAAAYELWQHGRMIGLRHRVALDAARR